MRPLSVSALVCALLFFYGACAGTAPTDSTTPSGRNAPPPGSVVNEESGALSDGSWRLTGYGAPDNLTAPAPGVSITLDIESGAGRISGSAGCNRYSASFTTDGNRLALGPVGVTKRLCMEPDGVMDAEHRYTSALASVARYTVKDGQLTLHCADASVLIFTGAGAVESGKAAGGEAAR